MKTKNYITIYDKINGFQVQYKCISVNIFIYLTEKSFNHILKIDQLQ